MIGDVVNITEAAVSRVKDIVKSSGKNAKGIRISLKKAGCAGFEYTVDLVFDHSKEDDLVEKDGAKIWIDPVALLYIIGMEIDFENTKLCSGFVFRNPNQISACGCGQSVELKRADLVEKFHDKNC
ncbi:Fe-S cluster assembly scaffold SufA [Candidatus Liberibacter americanus]|uniref:Iron binding protein SufA for iron-sulfur cluster assembly n=1 Tax=Candidatus Liberibacter americanus str. Sao Paulo TaxID=1261131 RepID=U6B4H3_9HYPH|nr:Fe-S cluster assembly scaffold SufA [Candidatus Liberibacter americanus]AHA27969.1 Iron binding protein SufA for iron-sulfur cluster assembly [Candidatus Liberibacter americanus str. Sao Paulo]EMS35855.1 FeS assembly scaffold SufA [Candidatus Liberibacter americanus PW_SP]